MTRTDEIVNNVAQYYAGKLAEHGTTARGVDWNGPESQTTRFHELCRVIEGDERFSVNDLGCGYGALLDYVSGRYSEFQYNGYDVSSEMIDACRQRHESASSARFVVAAEPSWNADYGVASGVFNVRLGYQIDEWTRYVEDVLCVLDRTSLKGFAFNCLTSYSDPDRMRESLHYVDPCVMFDFCKRRFSPHVALLHDYGLYEFTILVRKKL